MVEGYGCIIEELNFIPNDVQAALNPIIDETTTMFSYLGMTFKIHPNFFLLCTCNPGYKGTSEANDSFKNRYKNIAVPAVSKQEFLARIKTYKNYSPAYKDKFFELLYDYQGFVQDLADSIMESATVCIRHAFKFLDALAVGQYNKDTQKYEAFDLEGFTKQFVICYIYATCHWDGDTTASLQAFIETPDFKEKMNALYSLYPYQKDENVEEVYYDLDSWKADKEAGFIASESSASSNDSEDDILQAMFNSFDELQA
jgi:hypothetical protein